MLINSQVSLHRLILSLSQALDCGHPKIQHHQQRVAYIALAIARGLGMDEAALFDVFLAGSLHDVGLLRSENKIRALAPGGLESVAWHGEAGYRLLQEIPFLARPAEIIRHHHVAWADGGGAEEDGRPVPMASHILGLADAVERWIDRDVFILNQTDTLTQRVVGRSGRTFNPYCVLAFQEASAPPSFWLDCVSDRLYGVLLDQLTWPIPTLDERAIGPVAQVFARVVDGSSRWTTTHSAGVAATAVALAARLNFSPREQLLMRAAGYLHDLGKLAVPTDLLEKPSGLAPMEWNVIKAHTYHTYHILNTIGGMPQIREWAAFHHERLDGRGYPFRLHGKDLTLGSRLMAVADVFTALVEDRPFRRGLAREKVLEILGQQARAGALDPDVIALVDKEYADLDAIRRHEQDDYAVMQHQLEAMAGTEACEPAGAAT